MQRSDDPNVLNDVIEFAKNMPYATGALLCKDSAMCTVIFLNETTAITVAHHFKGRARAAHIVVACDKYDLWFTNYNHDWNLTLQNVKNSGAPWACVKQQYPMSQFTELEHPYRDLDGNEYEYLSKLQKLWEDAQSVCFSKDISFNDLEGGNPYSLNGPDISVLKLRTPITLTKKTITLQTISKDIFNTCKAYSFGFSGTVCLNDGKMRNEGIHKGNTQGITIPLMCFLAHNLQQSEDGKYACSKLYSAGGQDEQFIIEKLPALDENNRFIGLEPIPKLR